MCGKFYKHMQIGVRFVKIDSQITLMCLCMVGPKDRSSNRWGTHILEALWSLGISAPLEGIAMEKHDKKENSTRPDVCRLAAVSCFGARHNFRGCITHNNRG